MSSLYDINLTRLDGESFSMRQFAGRVLLIVNVASKCGFTKQYKALQSLQDKYESKGFRVLGFPCNDFSNVGEHLGFRGKFGPLYSYGVELIDRYHPKWFIAENVGGISSSNEGKAFKKILFDLEHSGKGYNLTFHKH